MTWTPKKLDAPTVEKVARTLYVATKTRGAGGWAQVDGDLRDEWIAIAIAAIDLTNGARARMIR